MKSRIYVVLFLVMILAGCRTQKTVEIRYERDSVALTDTFFKALHRYTLQSREVYDSVYIDYRIGTVDSALHLRVDTVIRDATHTRIYKDVKQDSDSTGSVHNSCQVKEAVETKTVEPAVAKKGKPWKKVLWGVFLVAVVAAVPGILKKALK